jgi:hypothetical protein
MISRVGVHGERGAPRLLAAITSNGTCASAPGGQPTDAAASAQHTVITRTGPDISLCTNRDDPPVDIPDPVTEGTSLQLSPVLTDPNLRGNPSCR